MRRILAITIMALAVAAISLVGSGASDDTGSSYLVDAEFRNAFSVIPGEDVKIAGVKVGKIKDLDVTERQTASVLIEITEPGFGDWRADAECSIRPQSLIGEKFVECTPTKPRPQGAKAPPLLKTEERDGETVAVLPVDRTRRPVDLDLLNNILRLPYRERLTILINEFGAGVAGRGQDLNKIIRTADPALKATDEVLDLLADQNDVLEKLAVDSDQALAPLARDRDRLTGFIKQAGTVAEATAERRGDLEKNIERLPRFFRELRPTMERLGALSDEGAPLLSDLNAVGPDLARFIRELGPFSESATPALTSLGDASVVGREALNKSRPIFQDLRRFAGSSKVLSRDLRQLTESIRDTGGIERLMDFGFYQVAAVNGFDQYGHYLRAQLLVNLCSDYATENDPACTANFINEPGEEAETRAAPRLAPVAQGAKAGAKAAPRAAATAPQPEAAPAPAAAPDAAPATPRAAATPKAGAASADGSGEPDPAVTGLLDYLMEGGS